MNIERLKQMERQFYMRYPDGWSDEELQSTLKKHKVGKMEQLAKEILSYPRLQQELNAIQDIVQLISKSSLVSVFEKVRFRNLINESDDLYKRDIVRAVRMMIHENEEQGFAQLVQLLDTYKLAKWPIITVLLTYYRPTVDVFVKPTTVKRVIQVLELEDVHYTPKVNYHFYQAYRRQFQTLTTHVNKELSITNGHFSGFLMMTME